MGIISTSNHPKHLWPGVADFINAAENDRTQEWKELCEVRTSDKAYEEMVREVGMGLAPIKEQGGSVAYDSTSEGPTSRWTHLTYGLGYIVTREETEDNQYVGKSIDRALSCKIGMMETKENVVANIYNRGFSGSYVGADGVALLSASHPTAAGNQSNLMSTSADLSEAALEDLTIQIMGNTDDRGNKAKLMPQKLIVSRQNVYEATRILKSINQNDTANNAINALRVMNVFPEGVVVNRYLSDPDAFFIKTNARKGIVLFQRRAMEFTKDNDFGTENAMAKFTERYSIFWGEWRALFGSAGA